MNEILQQRIDSVRAGKDITHAQIMAKQNLREQLDRDLEEFLASGSEIQVLPNGFSNFRDGLIPPSKARAVTNEQDRIDREKAIEAKNQEIREYKAAAIEQRKAKAKQKYDAQIKEQITVLGRFVGKSKNENDFKRLAEMAGYRVRHFRDAAKGHSKLGDDKWALVKKLISNFKFGDAA
ncbi:hypothetical protein B9T25_13045 [Acinetobacter sp. ANC 4470]|uniref:hypothetical protein n=1 Tax=Acinetobacter sp. ANC 4470 TaxID=1977881 RepID=UPI000A350219|nr:hypothetical protein [Acinetobacter sp. ANC 4470]OTG64361.1 hypothetical protein B9T25_13045 [Acinetobacter sp. ANC 4470]